MYIQYHRHQVKSCLANIQFLESRTSLYTAEDRAFELHIWFHFGTTMRGKDQSTRAGEILDEIRQLCQELEELVVTIEQVPVEEDLTGCRVMITSNHLYGSTGRVISQRGRLYWNIALDRLLSTGGQVYRMTKNLKVLADSPNATTEHQNLS